MPSGIPVKIETLEQLTSPARVAVFYDNLDEWMQLVDYQVQIALARQEKCICLVPENDRNTLRTFMEQRARESNWPSWRKSMVLLASSYFTDLLIESGPESVIEALTDTVKATAIEGFSGVSLIVNFDSLLIQHYGEPSLVLFAQQLHARLGNFPCRYYGIYDYRRYSLNHLQQLFVWHDHFVRNFHLYANTFSSIAPGPALVSNAEWLDRIVLTLSVQEDGQLWPDIVSHSFHSLALFSENGYLEYCNPAFCSLSGYSEEQLRGINLAEILEQAGFQSLPSLRTGEKIHFCVDKFHTPDQEIGLEFLVYCVMDSSQRMFYALSLADISETQRISDQLEEREEELQALLESINDTVFVMDKDEKYTGIYGNGIFEEDLNHNIFLGKTPAEIYVPDKAELFSQANQRALSGERATYEYTLGSGASLRHYHTALAPIRNKYRQITGLVGISRNITEVKTAQAELEKKSGRNEGPQ
jgi:PAS domain S-box